MIRTPLLPLDALRAWLELPSVAAMEQMIRGSNATTQVDNLCLAEAIERSLQATQDFLRVSIANPVLQEAILVGSPDLFQSLPTWLQEPSSKKGRQVAKNVLRYLVRMTTRPTPFGIFAGVSRGHLGPAMNLRIGSLEQNRKRTRLDMQWLLYIVRRLEQQPEVLPHLRFYTNTMSFVSGGRLYLPGVDSYGQAESEKTVSVRANPLVLSTLALARHGASLAEMKQHIWEKRPNLSEKQIDGFLTGLRQQGALLSNLRPPLTSTSPVRYVLSQLPDVPGCEEARAQLRKMLQLAETYDALPLGEGSAIFQELYRATEIIDAEAKIKSTLEVDMATACESSLFSHAVAGEVARAAEALLRVSTAPLQFEHLSTYRREFLERYGEGREVPVLELLDEDIGLGAPPLYQHPPRDRQAATPSAPQYPERNAALLALAATALRDGQREVPLDEAMLKRLEARENWQDILPASLELYVFISAPTREAIDRGEYQLVIGPRIGDFPAGRSFGRFCDVMGEDTIADVRRLLQEDEARQPERLFAELVYLPSHGHAANVAIRPAFRQYEVVIAASPGVPRANTLPLDDLVVGVRGDRFYLRSLARNAEIRISNTHLLNYTMAPNICRFLTEICSEGTPPMMPFDWGHANALPFLPRLRVGRVVLTAARWLLPVELIGAEESKTRPTLAEWYRRLQQWRQQWRVPRYMYLVEADNRLLLDLENALCLADLADECWIRRQSKGTLALEEMLPGFEDAWTEGMTGRYLTEFVVPLKRHPFVAQTPQPFRQPATIAPGERLRLIGSDWLYAKLYSGRSRHDDLLAGPVREFVQQAVQKGLVTNWFFIRYADPEPHLRLRLRGEPAKLLAEVLPAFAAWGHALVDSGLMRNFVLDSYDREIERYGGLQGMELAECIFEADSSAVTAITALRISRALELSPVDLALHTVDDLLLHLGLKATERLNLYRMLRQGQEKQFGGQVERLRKNFHNYRKTAQRIVGDPVWVVEQRGGQQLQDCLQQRATQLYELGRQLKTLEEQGKLEISRRDFLGSCVHMHCNRLLGVNRQQEFEVMYDLERTLESLQRYSPPYIQLNENAGTAPGELNILRRESKDAL